VTERYIDPEIIRGFLKVRDDLLFWLTEQDGPTAEQAATLWDAYKLPEKGLEDLKGVTGFVEELTTFNRGRP